MGGRLSGPAVNIFSLLLTTSLASFGAASASDQKKCPLKVCEPGSGGAMLLPIFKDDEQRLSPYIRAPIYVVLLLYLFAGVAIVSDVFMGAIEKITSKKKRVFLKSTAKWRTITVWNDTVANLTLMALGSSAPEILLGVIEICGNGFYAGDLGPSTIVGSAAFNMFCIIAVCIMAIPSGESRTISDLGVFAVTATFSVLAYAWLYGIVAVWTPEAVTIPEAVTTFFFFPVLVGMAFAADRGYFSVSGKQSRDTTTRNHISIGLLTAEEIAELELRVRAEYRGSTPLSDEQLAKMIEARVPQTRNRAHYRCGAIRDMTGGRSGGYTSMTEQTDVMRVFPSERSVMDDVEDQGTYVFVNFASIAFEVMEDIGTICVPVELRFASPTVTELSVPLAVKYGTTDGTAIAPADYISVQGELIFQPGETRKEIEIEIVDDEEFEDDEQFYVSIWEPRLLGETADCRGPQGEVITTLIGDHPKATVKILDDDNPGILSFESELLMVAEDPKDKTIEVVVHRKCGCSGKVSCSYYTENDTAIENKDFEPVRGVLEFENGQSSATIRLTIIPRGRYEKEEVFRLILDNGTGGVKFDADTDGSDECDILTVCITADCEARQRIDRVVAMLRINWDKAQLGHQNWKEQFRDAILVGGGGDDEDGKDCENEKPGAMAWVMHILTVFWKVLFAFIPPSDYCDGWLCFVVSLGMIGLVTLFIGDAASLLGCVMSIPDAITAITFVALGTSLPDTFASRTAAVQDEFADASIGNVTGSNSVNVFLGIGISWSCGAFYWAGRTGDDWLARYPGTAEDIQKLKEAWPQGGAFAVYSGDLSTSVGVFCACAITCISVLMLRRRIGAGELGGPAPLKHVTAFFFVFLWFTYLGVSCYAVLDRLKDDPCW